MFVVVYAKNAVYHPRTGSESYVLSTRTIIFLSFILCKKKKKRIIYFCTHTYTRAREYTLRVDGVHNTLFILCTAESSHQYDDDDVHAPDREE